MEEREIICSRQNRRIVGLCKLTDRKERDETGRFRFDGIKLLREALRNGVAVEAVFVKDSDAKKIGAVLTEEGAGKDFPVFRVEDPLFDRISEEKSPEGVITIAKHIDKFQKIVTIYNSAEFSALRDASVVLLESVRDPSNLGAIIRSAAALGVDRLIVSSDCADVFHPRAVRASMGMLFRQRIDAVDDLPAVIRQLRESGRRVYAAMLDPHAVRLGEFPIRAGDCVVIGNEGHGLTKETADACGDRVIIPMAEGVESFNAAVAASILMWEFRRREQ